MKKRILPVLLALCMVMSLLPVAFAEDPVTCTCTSDSCTNDSHANKGQACGATVEDTTDGNTLCNACKPADDGDDDVGGGGDDDGDDDAGDDVEQPDPEEVGECGIGGCTLGKGHTDDHKVDGQDIEKCLGYAGDDRCSAGTHIAGCPKYACRGCDHTQDAITYGDYKDDDVLPAFTGDPEDCTSAPGCPFCSTWNSYVTGTNNKLRAEYTRLVNAAETEEAKEAVVAPTYLTACTCADCRPNPAMGVVTDESGNVVDPTEPTDPAEPTEPEAPKAEDFTDMEDWMVADVQVALDKGWLQGNGDGKFGGRDEVSMSMIATVVARMTGEGDFTGANWWGEAMEWASENDAFEGLELYPTGPMARKDLVLVIWRMAGSPESEHELDFTDVDGLEGDHLTAMQWAVENGIVKGNGDGTVTPDGSVNRAALCTMLVRYDGLEK